MELLHGVHNEDDFECKKEDASDSENLDDSISEENEDINSMKNINIDINIEEKKLLKIN